MEIVELRVQVEKSQLDALQAQVKALQGTTINFGAGAGGSGGKGSDPSAGVRAGLAATEKQANRTGQSILSVVGKVAKWTAVTTAVYAPIHAFKEALTTIKQLDTEMVNIQKVTGASAQQMKQFQDQAYALASQYGRSAMDVAESMTAFARAGYGDQLDQMAELSTLMQNVGYVSADTANSMLLAVDAAWHLNGSQTELMKVMDGVDKITNQNATDFGKMAEGMTVAASVFAESGESIQTFAALVGTGTAVTQRSGSEIARGLRTVLMNIRQIKGETEDGELIDGESIANASKALKEFAGINTMENGELRKASDILSELADKWDELDSVQQSAISEALAGKRQANILMALMGNWDMYEKQMEEYATAAGTALKENEIYMDSWAAKSEQLSATWTEFVSNLVNTDVIKGSLDAITGTLNFLQTDIGEAVVQAGLLAAAFVGIGKAAGALKTAFVSGAFGQTLPLVFAGLADGAVTAKQAVVALSEALFASPLFLTLGAAAVTVGFLKAVDAATVTLEEQKQVVDELKASYDQLYGAGSELDALQQRVAAGEQLNSLEQQRLAILQAQAEAMQQQIQDASRIAFNLFQAQDTNGTPSHRDKEGNMVYSGASKDEERLDNMNKSLKENARQYKNAEKNLEEYRSSLLDLIADNQDWYNQMKEFEDMGFGDSFTQAQREAMALYETISKLLSLGDEDFDIAHTLFDFETAGVGFADFAGEVAVNAEQLRDYFKKVGLSAEEAQQAIDGLRADGVIVLDVENDGIEETLSYLEELQLAVQDENGWKIDIEGVRAFAEQIGMSADQANNLLGQLSQIDGVSFQNANGEAQTLLDTYMELAKRSPMDLLVSANTEEATAKMAEAKEKADEVEATDPHVDLTATDGVSLVADTAKAAAQSVEGTYTATFTGNTSGLAAAVGRAKAMLEAFKTAKAAAGLAQGTKSWSGGPVLLGDEASPDGSPRPELVITKGGKAFIAGLAGPTMANLPAGTRVYPYEDTAGIMSGEDMTQITAFAGGNGLGGLSLAERYLRGANAGGGGGGNNNANNVTNANAGGNKGGGGGGGNANKAKGGGGKAGGGGGGSSGSSKEQEDTYLQQLQDELDLLKAQYEFLEASGASTDALIGKSGEIQNKLHDINERLRETGGEEKDIVDNSTAWYEEQKNIEDLLLDEQEKKKQAYEDERDLLETISTLMDYQGKSAVDRINQLRKIQDNLHREAEYLRSIKASQAEINELSIEWWKIQNDILAIQQDLLDELDAAINEYLRTARKERDAELKLIDKQIDKLREERDIQQEQLDIEEKRKAVEEARFALENAQRNRTVRYYNAATGQWEWGADAKTVASAKKAYDQALKDVGETERDREFNLRIEALELQKEEINNRYDLLEARWETLSDSFSDPMRDIKNILTDLLASGRLTEEQVELVKALVGDIEQYTADIRDMLSFASYMAEVEGGSFEDYLAIRTGDPNAGSNFSSEFKEFLEQNPDTDWIYTDSSGTEYHSNGATKTNTGSSTSSNTNSYTTSGGIHIASGGASSKSSSTKTATSSSGGSYTIGSEKGLNFVNNASAGSTMTGGDGSEWKKNSDGSTTITKNGTTYTVYDSGGVLSGMGGIKGTSEDEIVIPPALANYMLRPSANQQFRQRMAELGFLYGAGPVPSSIMSGASGRGGSSHYGDIYQYGNITLSESQAKSMTVYELAQKSRGLSVYSAN